MVIGGEEAEAEGSGDVGAEEEKDEPATCLSAVACHVVVEKHADQDRNGDERAVWDLHERRHQRRESKALDDDRSEIADSAIGDVAYDAKKEEEVRFNVRERFADLVPLEVLVFDARLVFAKTFDSDALFVFVETFGCDRAVGEKDELH